jgi:hypothetical protein
VTATRCNRRDCGARSERVSLAAKQLWVRAQLYTAGMRAIPQKSIGRRLNTEQGPLLRRNIPTTGGTAGNALMGRVRPDGDGESAPRQATVFSRAFVFLNRGGVGWFWASRALPR